MGGGNIFTCGQCANDEQGPRRTYRSGNTDHEMSKQLKIRHRMVKEFNNLTSPKGLGQLIENLNNKQKEAIEEIGFGGFLHSPVDMIPGKLAVWLVHNIDARSCFLPLAHGRMRVTKHDVHMPLALFKLPLEIGVASILTMSGWTNDEIKSKAGLELKIGFCRGYLEDTLHKITVTDKEEEVNEEKRHNKSAETKAKIKN
ncbi:hypothetical protein Cgig2_019195 [Carnegiea gigantea]|uniref:Uncharacterized protein n=1 Tax=Carnegiea gigantea TaxID=171969 RepID=A0A9Q1K257_9CARY|nr:hypothetical protein Cgig2_019195 [Carnegiea gigantea]